jgi:hypothetical protein
MHLSHAGLLILVLIDPVLAHKGCIQAFMKALVPAKVTVAAAHHPEVLTAELVGEIVNAVV